MPAAKKAAPKKETKKEEGGVIVLYKDPQAGVRHIEVDTLVQAKAVQAQLNEWYGARAMTAFIYL